MPLTSTPEHRASTEPAAQARGGRSPADTTGSSALDEVRRSDDGLAAAELDDRDRAQVHRPHPEPLERQIEQGQQRDLEHAVVGDEHRPRVIGQGLAVTRDLVAVARPGRPPRGERLTVEAAGVFLDYSKNRITDETLALLVQLAEECGLRARIDAMFSGDRAAKAGDHVMHQTLDRLALMGVVVLVTAFAGEDVEMQVSIAQMTKAVDAEGTDLCQRLFRRFDLGVDVVGSDQAF